MFAKVVTAALGILLFAAHCWSSEISSRGPKAYLAENLFEFEPVLEGTEFTHEFVLRNHGDTTLVILKIESG